MEALEALYPDRLAEQVERLAHHALRGEVWDKAVAYCRQAGAKAMARSAYREAVACFEQALVALRHLPEQRDTSSRPSICASTCAMRSLARRARAHPDCLREAETLAEALNDQRRLGRSLPFAFQYSVMGDYDRRSRQPARPCPAEALGDFAIQVMAHFYLGRAYHDLGDYRRAIDCSGALWHSSKGSGSMNASASAACPL